MRDQSAFVIFVPSLHFSWLEKRVKHTSVLVYTIACVALAGCAQRPLAVAATPTPTVPQYCKLHVDGGLVKDASGQPVLLHGATLPSLIEMNASELKPEQRLRDLAAAGARVVRLAITEREMTPTFVPATVSPFIDQANALGILVVLSYQNDVTLSANNQADNAEDWMRLALQYLRNAPGVWFEPFAHKVDSPKWQGMHQRMIDVARGYKADNVFLVDEPTWLNEGKADVTGGNIAHGVSSMKGWPASAQPLVVISGDMATLHTAQSAGAWAISDGDAITDEMRAVWKTSVKCK